MNSIRTVSSAIISMNSKLMIASLIACCQLVTAVRFVLIGDSTMADYSRTVVDQVYFSNAKNFGLGTLFKNYVNTANGVQVLNLGKGSMTMKCFNSIGKGNLYGTECSKYSSYDACTWPAIRSTNTDSPNSMDGQVSLADCKSYTAGGSDDIIILMLGVNDIMMGYNTDTLKADTYSVIQTLKQKQPNAKIVVASDTILSGSLSWVGFRDAASVYPFSVQAAYSQAISQAVANYNAANRYSNVAFVDFFGATLSDFNSVANFNSLNRALLSDNLHRDIHPNYSGANRNAQILACTLVRANVVPRTNFNSKLTFC